jgi:deazaflavin-dependent oxidoreductase (nitroreductase family)
MAVDLTQHSRQSTVKLTTTGRKSGRKHTVPVWFVVAAPDRIYVQHVQGATADWYKNLLKTPDVELDFGAGVLAARAQPIMETAEIRRVLALVRRKYLMAWIVQLFGIGKQPVAAAIALHADT